MIKKYIFNKQSTQKYLYSILLQLLIYFVVLLIGFIIYKEIDDSSLIVKIILGVLIVWSILYLVPLFVLYFNHMANSRSVIFSYNDSDDSFSYKSSKTSITFTMDDIRKIELYLTPNAYEKSIDWQYFGKYHYYKLFILDNESINLSCLVCDEIEKIVPKKIIEKKKKYLPIIE